MDFKILILLVEFFFGLICVFFTGYLIAFIIHKVFHVNLQFEDENKRNEYTKRMF
jgi:hypothetical protein